MFGELLVKELKTALLDLKAAIYAGLVIVLVISSFVLLKGSYGSRQRNYTSLDAQYEKIAGKNRMRYFIDYLKTARGGKTAVVRPQPMQTFVQGLENLPVKMHTVNLDGFKKQMFPFLKTELAVNPIYDFFPVADFSLIILFAVSLCVLLLSHDTICGEREQGTLRLILSNQVPASLLILAKLTGGYIIIMLPVIAALLGCMVIAALSSAFTLSGGDTAALTALAGLTAVYLLALYSLGVLVSTVFRKSSTSIGILVLVWLFFIVVIHNGSLVLLKGMTRTEPLHTAMLNLKPPHRYLFNYCEQWAQEKYGKNWDQLIPEQQIEELEAGLVIQKETLMPLLDRHIRTLERDYRLLTRMSLVSPSLVFRLTAADLSGTGIRAYLVRMRGIYRYLNYFRSGLIKEMKTDLLYPDQKPRHGRYGDEKKIPPILDELEPYRHAEEPVARRIKGSLLSIMVLCGYAVLFFMLSFMAFVRGREV